MLNIKKVKGILICTSVSFFLFANCPENLKINSTIKSYDIQKILELSKELEKCPDYKDSLALSYHTLGALFFNFDQNLESAISFTEKGLKLREQLFTEKPNIDLGKSYNNLGVFYSYVGKNQLAKDYLKKAAAVFENLDLNRMVRSKMELAKIHTLDGEYKIAEDIFNLIIIGSEKNNQKLTKATALLNLGFLFSEKKELEKSIEYLNKSLSLLNSDDNSSMMASCYNNLGKAYYNLNDFSKSVSNYKKALEVFMFNENCHEISKGLNNIGLAYQKDNQLILSFNTLQEGLKMAQSCNSKEIIAQSYDNIGEYYLSTKDYSKALFNFQKAIQTLIPKFERNEDWHNPTKMDVELAFNKIDLLIYLGDKAKTLRLLSQSEKDQKHLTSALELFELGDFIIDQLRKEHQDQDTKLFWRKEAIPFYENAIEVCYEMQNVEKAFFFFEKSKAILLLEALQTSDALALIPDSLKNQIQTSQQQLLKTKEELENTNSKDSKRENIIRDLVSQQAEFEYKIKQLEKDYSKFFEMKFGTTVISLSDVQDEFSKLKEKTAIHYFYGKKNIYAITIHSQKSKLHQLGSTSSIEKEIRTLLSFFEKSSNIENAPNDFLQQAKKVYDILIAPLSVGEGAEIVIFPDGALAYLPFEALVGGGSSDIASANYLIKNHAIQYGYSATIFSKLNKKENQSTENQIAGFAPFADGSVNSKYTTLAFSQDELGEISDQVDGIFLKNQNATKRYFLENVNEFSVLHLSTHAFSSATESKPHIVFADTSLFLSELYGLEIPADLVVLSACQSNIGKLSPGEGVMSLGRGFTFAGSKSLVSSLWNVNAVSTSMILSDFYKKLQDGVSKNKSLHSAKLAYLENENIPSYERSPYYWAGLIYYGGDGGVILKEKTNSKFYGLLIFGVVCFFMGFYFFRKKPASG